MQGKKTQIRKINRNDSQGVRRGDGSNLWRFIVRPEHRLCMQCRLGDNAMDMQEEVGISSGEVSQESLRHGSQMSLDIIRQVLIVIFL
jgi:hypothetical protein